MGISWEYHVGKTCWKIHQPWLGMATIPPVKMVAHYVSMYPIRYQLFTYCIPIIYYKSCFKSYDDSWLDMLNTSQKNDRTTERAVWNGRGFGPSDCSSESIFAGDFRMFSKRQCSFKYLWFNYFFFFTRCFLFILHIQKRLEIFPTWIQTGSLVLRWCELYVCLHTSRRL